MEKDRMLHPGDVFTDKDRKYQVIAVAYHAKSNEKMIVYQQLFDNFKILITSFTIQQSQTPHEVTSVIILLSRSQHKRVCVPDKLRNHIQVFCCLKDLLDLPKLSRNKTISLDS